MAGQEPLGIQWPSDFTPEAAPVAVRNEIEIAAPPERAWAWLVRATLWPSWYPNSKKVRLLNGTGPDLTLGTRFHWWTFGLPITSEVREFLPHERLAWDASGPGVRAYHAWRLTPTPRGCHVLTEETQHGLAAQLNAFLMPKRMYKGHELWLERLRAQAEGKHAPTGRAAT